MPEPLPSPSPSPQPRSGLLRRLLGLTPRQDQVAETTDVAPATPTLDWSVFYSRRATTSPAPADEAAAAPVAPPATPAPPRRPSVALDWSVFERAKQAAPTIEPESLRSDQ
jgi:hypothetical protein